jgi:hypothetical protein
MKPSVFFSAFEPLHEVPQVCDVCHLDPPVLSYEVGTTREAGEPEEQKGFCCRWCAAELLQKVERADDLRRAQERTALRVDEFEIIDFREPELASSHR